MGTALTGTEIKDTYDSLIKITDNGPISGTAKYLSDGLGNDSVLALSTSRVGIGTTSPDHPLQVNGNVLFKNTLNNAFAFFAKEADESGTLYLYNNGTLKNVFATNGNSYINGGNVGIGTDSPVTKLSVSDGTNCLHVGYDASGPYISGANNPFTVYKRLSYDAADHVFYSSSAESMRITSAGNVGINTSNPTDRLSVYTTTDYGNNSEYANATIGLGNASYPVSIRSYRYGGSYLNGLDLYYNDGTPRLGLRLDSVGNVGINTVSPARKIQVDGGSITSDTPTMRISSTDGSGTNKFGIEFYSNSGADVRGKLLADNSGRVYLDDNGGGGIILAGNGGSNVGIGTSSPAQNLSVEENTLNPSLVSLTGSFSTSRGVVISLDADELGANEAALKFTTNVAAPYGGYVFSTQSGEKMRILSSGGITFNGDTAAANALDDYEEGTFTPTMGGATFSLTLANGFYTKIGRQVSIYMDVEGTYSSATGTFYVNLPFNVLGGSRGEGVVRPINGVTFTNYVTCEAVSTSLFFEDCYPSTGSASNDMNSSNFNSAGFRFFAQTSFFV
jgi:hypothetical protein